MKVFISSTYEDLKEYRKAAIETVNKYKCVPLTMEHFGARDGGPVDESLDDVRECDIFVGIYAHRYGFVPKGSKKSITQKEYDLAKKERKPCLCFVVDGDFDWKPKFFEVEKHAELKAFLEKVKDKNVVTSFTDAADFRTKFATSLGNKLRKMESGEKVDKEPPEPVKLEIPQEYKEWIENFHSTLSIDQLSKKGEVVKISLPELYIHLETANPFQKPGKDGQEEPVKGDKEGEPKEPQNIDIETLLSRVNCILLRGAAGMGKTTLIKHLTYALTHGQGPISLGGCLPLPVFLKDLWPIYKKKLHSKHDDIRFETLLENYIKKWQYPLKMELIKGYLSKKRVLFLLDGLDEVPDHLRPPLVEMIAEFQFANKKNRFLITGRPHGIADKALERFGQYLHDINPLDNDKINGFISGWFRSVMGQAVGLAKLTAADMISDIKHNEHISVFTQNPLLLTAVCVLYQDGKRLPEQRADLYERIVANLLYKRFQDAADPDRVGRIEECLMHVAFEMQNRNARSIEVSEAVDQAEKVFEKEEGETRSKYRKRMERMFDDIEPKCGLLNRTSTGEVEFSHKTFQEFLAAKYMLDKGLGYENFLEQDWWEESILLYIGLISLNRKKDSNEIIKKILESGSPGKKRFYILAAKALRDIQAYKRDSEALTMVRDNLMEIIESGALLEERFEAGDILGSLGDPRIRSDNMIKVAAGEFIRGSESKEAYDREKPVRRIYLDEYKIGKYPVTNEEYRKFVEDGGYQDEDFWTPEGWQWVKKKKIIEPDLWHDRKWNGPNFPVVGVSWYEAYAYTEWLSKKAGKPYRLSGKRQPAARTGELTPGVRASMKTNAIIMQIWVDPARWVYSRKVRVPAVVSICQAMSMSGVRTGLMKSTMRKALIKILQALRMASTGYSAAAIGSTLPGMFALLTATGTSRPTAGTMPVSVFPRSKGPVRPVDEAAAGSSKQGALRARRSGTESARSAPAAQNFREKKY